MNKLKILIAVVLSLALILTGAYLPKLIASALDNKLSQTPSYSDMQSIQLDVGKEQRLAVLDKLALLGIVETANTVPAQMNMDENQVKDAVYAFMQQCETAGILQLFDSYTTSIHPKLLYDLTNPANYIFVWTVSMFYEGDSCHQYFLCDVDDQTGQILCVSYDIYNKPYEMDGVWERNRAVVDAITDLYFDQFGLTSTANNIENAPTVDGGIESGALYDYREVDGGVTEVVYTFDSPSFGEFHIQFNIDGAGGYMISFFK